SIGRRRFSLRAARSNALTIRSKNHPLIITSQRFRIFSHGLHHNPRRALGLQSSQKMRQRRNRRGISLKTYIVLWICIPIFGLARRKRSAQLRQILFHLRRRHGNRRYRRKGSRRKRSRRERRRTQKRLR